jgi:hypothetical protein
VGARAAWMWSRSARRTTMRTSLQHWPIEWSWRPSAPLLANVRICGTAPDGIRCNRSSASDQHRSGRAQFNTTTLTSATIRRSEQTIMSDTRSSGGRADSPDAQPDTSSGLSGTSQNLDTQLVGIEDARQPVTQGLVHIDHEVVVDVVPRFDDLELRFHVGQPAHHVDLEQ